VDVYVNTHAYIHTRMTHMCMLVYSWMVESAVVYVYVSQGIEIHITCMCIYIHTWYIHTYPSGY
jgi:hypothetical protein